MSRSEGRRKEERHCGPNFFQRKNLEFLMQRLNRIKRYYGILFGILINDNKEQMHGKGG